MMSADDTAMRMMSDPSFQAIKRIVIDTTGLAYLEPRDAALATELAERMAALKTNTVCDYHRYFIDPAHHQDEIEHFASKLTIGETYFFRHRELFDALRDTIFPQLLARPRATRQLRIWSAGCSIGAEPASVAIVLLRDLEHLTRNWQIDIVATDINQSFLKQARRGTYNQWAMRSTPPDIARDCFDTDGDHWTLKPRYRRIIRYQYHNLIQHHAPSMQHNLLAFDLILCRNVFIYFDQKTVRQLTDRFHHSLADDGYLTVGLCELSHKTFEQFATVRTGGVTFYHRKATNAVPDAPAQPQACDANHDDFTALWSAAQTLSPATATLETHVASTRETDDWLDGMRQAVNQGALERAETLCRRRLADARFDAVAYLHLGLILDQLGRRQEAQTALRQAIYLDHDLPLAHYLLGMIERRDGRELVAARSFANAMDLIDHADGNRVVICGDDITAADLRRLVNTQQELNEVA